MNWRIEFSNKAAKFAREHNLLDTVQDFPILTFEWCSLWIGKTVLYI